MHFKHPEILYFLFLLVIPILVHLFQFRRFKKQYFTNVRFLRELTLQTRKSSKIKKWLLLATRLLILACIVLAFAQPFFKAKDSAGGNNEMFIILDNSFSMQAKGKKGELLRRAVEDLLAHVPADKTFSLITNNNSYWNTDIRSIRNDLQNIGYSASEFRADAAMAKVTARKSALNKDIFIITDGLGVKDNQLQAIDSSSNTYFIVPEAEQRNNVSVDSAFINNSSDNFYEISVNLSVYGTVPGELPVALYNQQKLIGKTLTSLDSGRKTVTFTIPKSDFHGYAEISDNGLQYDNRLYFSISSPKKTSVLSIGTAEKSTFLTKIYSDREFEYKNVELRSLDYNSLEQQDVIVLNELPEIPQALQTTLNSFVEKGGNVIFIPSAEISVSNVNQFLSNFGSLQFGNLREGQKPVTRIAFAHPLYTGVFEKKIENFQYPTTAQSFFVSGNYPAILGYEDQSIFLTAVPNEISNVYVFAAPIGKQNSNFQNSPLIVPTFYNMAQSSVRNGVQALAIGSGKSVLIETTMAKDEIVNVSNSIENFIPVQQVLSNRIKLSFDELPAQAGNFGIYKRDELLQTISFNYARTESDLAEGNRVTLDNLNVVDSVSAAFNSLQLDRSESSLWKLFLLLGLLFLIAELLIQKFVK